MCVCGGGLSWKIEGSMGNIWGVFAVEGGLVTVSSVWCLGGL